MARGEIKIPIAVDTGGIQKQISNGLVDPIEDAEDALKKLEKVDAGQDLEKGFKKAQKATEHLEDDLEDTRSELKKLGYAAKDAGDDAKAGMNRAEDGVEEFGDEAKSTAKEAAASFDGSAESIIDAFQEVAANAFAGFGPAGMAAGLIAAAGIGIAVGAFQQAEEAAEELRQKANEYANDALDAGVSTDIWLSAAEQVVERIRELQDTKDNGLRLWFMEDPDDLEKWTDALKDMGREGSEVEDVLSSSTDRVKDYRDAIEESRDQLKKQRNAIIESGDSADKADKAKYDSLQKQLKASDELLGLLDDEIKLRDDSADAMDRQKDAGIEAATARMEAEQELAEVTAQAQEQVQDSVTGAYDSMRDAATEFATTEDGALNIERWLEYTQQHAEAVAAYQSNLQQMKLSPEQWSNLMEMPEEQRQQWVAQFVALPENAKAPYAAALNDLGSSGGSQAAVGFDDSFNPDADVQIQVETSEADSKLETLSSKKRTAEIAVKTTGKADAKAALDDLAKTRHATINVHANTSDATATVNSWRRNQESRPVYITVKARGGGSQLV